MKSRALMLTTMAIFAVLAVPVRLAAQKQNQEHPGYTVTDLGTLGGTFSNAQGINNKSWIDGFSTLKGDLKTHAFLSRNGVMTDLRTLGGPNSIAVYRPNERGVIVGSSETSTPDPLGEDFCGFGTHLVCHPFLWKKGVMTPLPTLKGKNGSAFEINNRGQVAGQSENATHDPTCVAPQVLQFVPVTWEKGEIHQLPTFLGDPDGFAQVINDNGQVAGTSGNCAVAGFHALLWQDGTPTDLGNLGGTRNNLPQDINNEGQVVGFSNLHGDTTNHAFLWTQDEGMQDLGTLFGDFSSAGFGINDESQVVGVSADASGNARAFFWQSGVMTDLNTLIPAGSPLHLLSALSINSRGEIVGVGLQTKIGQVHAFLATPCDGEHADNKGCEDRAAGTSATSQSPSVIVPESVRKLLRQRLGHWSGIPGLATGPTN